MQFTSHKETEKRRVVKFISGHGGVGKTQELFKEWNLRPNLKKLYLSHSHKFLSEQSARVNGSRHLYGLRHICPIIFDFENEFHTLISAMVEQGFSNKNICGLCEEEKMCDDRENCPYKLQFEDLPNTIIAPVEYAFTKLMKDYKPDVIAVDDCLYRLKEHPTKERLERLLWLLQYIARTPEKEMIKLSTLLNLNNIEDVLKHKLMPARKKWVSDELSYLKEHPKSEKTFLIDIDVEEFALFKKLSEIHGKRDQFATPILFYLFNHVCDNEDADLTIIDALGQNTSNELFMDRLIERYFKETHNGIELDYHTVEPRKVANSVIYRCTGREGAWYPTTSSITNSEPTRNHIKQCIKMILKEHFNDATSISIGLIKPRLAEPQDFFDNDYKVKSLNWGNLRGMNELEDCDVLFVIGTYLINKADAKENFGLFFAKDPTTMDMLEDRPHRGWYHYKDTGLEILRWSQEDVEQYQGIMRSRPLNHKIKIFSFGLIPKEVPEEIERGEEIQFFRKGGELIMANRKDCFLNFLLSEGGRVLQSTAVSYMASEFGISETRAGRVVSDIILEENGLRIEVEKGANGRQIIVCDKIVADLQRLGEEHR